MGEILEARRSEAQGRFERLVEQLRETEHRANDKACVFMPPDPLGAAKQVCSVISICS